MFRAHLNSCTCTQSDELCHFPLIPRYLAGDASDSDSGDESGGDADDDEPKESPKGESENQDDDKLDDSKCKKEVNDIDIQAALPCRNHQ